jgi:hypothetical protein
MGDGVGARANRRCRKTGDHTQKQRGGFALNGSPEKTD